MFSGIVETMGQIIHHQTVNDNLQLVIKPNIIFSDIKVGDSIAVNGVCLTVTDFNAETFNVTVVPETLRLTNIKRSGWVNLERSLQWNARIGGHCVQGHVDTTATIQDIQADGQGALLITLTLPTTLKKYVVNKGYITLDGMSITVIEAADDCFTITLIPHTVNHTIAQYYRVGSKVNIEVDIIGKYIEKMLGAFA